MFQASQERVDSVRPRWNGRKGVRGECPAMDRDSRGSGCGRARHPRPLRPRTLVDDSARVHFLTLDLFVFYPSKNSFIIFVFVSYKIFIQFFDGFLLQIF